MNTKQKIAAGLAALLLLASLTWYAVAFLPYVGLLEALATRGGTSTEGANPLLQPLALADRTTAQVRSYAMRQAYSSLVFEKHRSCNLSWHANNVLWYFASYLHFQDSDMFGIWVQCTFGCSRGLKEASLHYMHKDLQLLSKREVANLVAAVKGPLRYAPGSSANERRTDELLTRVRVQK